MSNSFTHLDLTYRLDNYPSHSPLPHDRIDRAINGAFAKWQAVSPFTFRKITSGEADIVLSFGSMKNPDAHGETTGHGIVFNDKRTWLDLGDELRAKNITTAVLGGAGMMLAVMLVRGIWEGVDGLDVNRPDVLSIAVHEIGHALGLADTSDTTSVMQGVANYYKMTNVNGAPIPQVDIDALKEANRQLFSNYYASHGVTGWFKRGAGFTQVSAGLDNTVWAINKNGHPCEFSPAQSGRNDFWAPQIDKMLQIDVFSAHMILGVTADDKLKIYNPPPAPRPQDHKFWLDVATGVRYVAIGGAKGALWAVGTDGKGYRHREFFGGASGRLETLQPPDWRFRRRVRFKSSSGRKRGTRRSRAGRRGREGLGSLLGFFVSPHARSLQQPLGTDWSRSERRRKRRR